MDFGFARFLEMFEERFRSRATTAMLAIIGVAVAVWGIGEIVDKIIYFYDLVKSAHFLTALAQENAATHIIVFAVQIAITFLILGFIWHWFYRRRIKALENRARKRVREELKAFEERAVRYRGVARLVGIEGGVVSGVFNLESSDVEASDRRPRHDDHYHKT